jgi:T-complex protein 1 subunit beta
MPSVRQLLIRGTLISKTNDNCLSRFFSENLKDDLLKIAQTSLRSKILSQHSEHFSKLAVDAVLRLEGSGNLDAIQIIKKLGGSMEESYLDQGFLLEKKPGMYQPQVIKNAKILIANTPMDTDKVILAISVKLSIVY